VSDAALSEAPPPAAPYAAGDALPRSAPPAATAATRRRPGALPRAALVAFAALCCVMMLSWPLGYDQGVFAANGDIVARGGAPYRDAWDVKGPLVFYLTAAVQLVFGRHAWGVRVVDVAVALTTAALLWRLLRRVASPATALAAAAAWPVVVAGFTYDEAAQYDGWVGAAALATVALATRRGGPRARDLLLAGALVGLASLVKPVYLAFLAVPAAAVVARQGRAWGGRVRDGALLAAGGLAAVAAGVALLAAQGALRDAWEVHVVYTARVYAANPLNSVYASTSPLRTRVLGIVGYLNTARVAILIPAAAGGAAALWRRDRVLAVAVVAWMAVGVGLVVLQGKFWPYHWQLVYPGVLALVALGVAAAADELGGVRALFRGARPRGAGGWLLATTVAAAAALWTTNAAAGLVVWAAHLGGLRDAAGYAHHFRRFGEIDPGDERAAADYLRARTPPGAPFAHWSIDAALPFLAGRPNATRFHNKRELTKTRDHPLTQAYRREYLARVGALRPTYVVLGRGGDLSTSGMTPWEQVRREFPELATLVSERYVFERRFGDLDLYRLRGAGVPAAPAAAPFP
jgi:hypothetical protein